MKPVDAEPKEPSRFQGEGIYQAARRQREAAASFVKSGQVDNVAHEAAPDTQGEADELKKAEQARKP